MSRDIALFVHIILGISLILLSVIILNESKRKSSFVKPLSLLAAVIGWVELVPAGYLYLTFYPATKTLVKAGAWPWAHAIIMETKEHWGLLLPVFTTVAAWLVLTGRVKESRKWWIMIAVLGILIGIFGRVVKMGASA